MQKRIAGVFVTFAAVLVVSSIARTQSSDPWIGTWKVNLEKSTYSPGPKPTVAATENRTFRAHQDHYRRNECGRQANPHRVGGRV